MIIRSLISTILLLSTLSVSGQAQFITNYQATTEVWLHKDSLRFHQELVIPPDLDTAYYSVWLAGYSSRSSFLGQQLIEEHHAKEWYSLPDRPVRNAMKVSHGQGSWIFSTPSKEILGIHNSSGNWDTIKIDLAFPTPSNFPTGFGSIREGFRLFHLFYPPLRTLKGTQWSSHLNHMRQQMPRVKGKHKVIIHQMGETPFTPTLIEDEYGNDDLIVSGVFFKKEKPGILSESGPKSTKVLKRGFKRISQFLMDQGFFTEKGKFDWENPLLIVDPKFPFSCTQAMVVPMVGDTSLFEAEIVREYVRKVLRDRGWDPIHETWMVEGLSGYLAQHYLETYYPDARLLGPFANSFLSRFFDLERYPPYYLNQYFYLFLARENLDEPMSLPAPLHSQLGYRSAYRGKSVQVIRFARDWVEETNFRRGMHRWYTDTTMGASDFWGHQRYYSNQDLSWVDGELIHTDEKVDYSLTDVEYCSTVYTVTVKNNGKLGTPYLVTGFKNGKKVIDVRYEGHLEKKVQNFHHMEYDKVEINHPGNFPELNYLNNSRYPNRLFKGFKPFRLQFYTSLENPDKTQIFWLPSVKFNAYDNILLGVQFYNRTLVPKKWEYRIAPDYSTGTGKLTGLTSLKYNYLPSASPFRRISFGVYARYFHYDRDLAFFRWSPAVNFYFRKPHPRSLLYRSITVRMVNVDKEQPREPTTIEDPIGYQPSSFNYQILNFRYDQERGDALRPYMFQFDVQVSQDFGKVSISSQQRIRINYHHYFRYRWFAGVMLYQNGLQDDYFSFATQRPTDYIFDLYYFGRSDRTGIWSQQVFAVDGGMRGITNFFSNRYMGAINLDVVLFKHIGVYGDISLFDWDGPSVPVTGGLSLIAVPEFLEVYFPFFDTYTDEIRVGLSPENIRFVFNVNLDDMLQRVRRGYF